MQYIMGHIMIVLFFLCYWFTGADQEHKTDEMHTALMEASMDGHVDVARLLLDHGAQVSTGWCVCLSSTCKTFR